MKNFSSGGEGEGEGECKYEGVNEGHNYILVTFKIFLIWYVDQSAIEIVQM